ncbi:hypothetical protein A3193_04420 [Candidatus Thiodiazotropha endoloripes]|uniref:lipopolysaccharide biosynthesis protein n=1 Tax=Candidatus Thiodiazotropha endoloripes TaxID=1818881 RepID=UPI00083D3661|nr:oligosaccharide flippase family protein [Candidatus Thiodiazotropha endoloripes]ODB88131.1 hypothetical protein A3193_04420 [Candidatus Thiodiazotropha endoloripes]
MNKANPSLRGAITLGMASAIDYVLQFILPIILVRSLESVEFGQYRVLWLITNTVMAIAPLYMPQSLFYFLPRAGTQRAFYIANVIWFLVLMAFLAALVISPWNPIRPDIMHNIPGEDSLVPAFVSLWVGSMLIEWLANTEGRIDAQARIVVIFSLLRVVIVGLTAWMTNDLLAVFISMTVLAMLRCLYILLDTVRRYGIDVLKPKKQLMREQLTYAGPFGIAGMFYALRMQSDQWIAASIFSLQQFASFSISLVVLPLANLIRQAVSNAILPAMNTCHHAGDIHGAIKINRDANTLTAVLLFPILAFLFVFAEDVISLIYTDQYVAGVSPMRVYLLGLAGQALVVNNVLITLAQGGFQMRLNGFILPIAILLSFWGAHTFGLMGAALGSAVTQWASHLINIQHVSHISNIGMSHLLNWLALSQFALAAIVAGFLAYASSSVLDFGNPFSELIISGMVLCVVYAVAVLQTRSIRQLYVRLRH